MKKQELNEILTRIEKLEQAVFGNNNNKKILPKKSIVPENEINFSINVRAFVKRYASKKSGSKKFTLLLAYLAKGDVNTDIQMSEVTKLWNKMTSKSLLGKFNRFYPNKAKECGWADSEEYGSYRLTSEWKDVL